MRISGYIPAFLALLVAGLLAIGTAVLAVDQIERGSHSAVSRVLEADGQTWADVSVDGLQVALSGKAPDEATRFRALKLAGKIVDSTRVIDSMTVEAGASIAPPRFSIEILRNDAGISLIGLVPGAMDRPRMAATITELAGGAEVTDLLESADYPVPSGWVQSLSFALDALGQLPRSKISVAANRVEITAISDSGAEKRRLETSLKNRAPDNVALTLNISAPRPVITPFTLRFLIDEEGGRFDACSAHTANGRARILAAAAEAGLQGRANCTLGLGVPTPRWPDAITAGISAINRLGGGAITFSDADVSLVAPATTDQDDFDRIVGELEAQLPDVFSLEAVKLEPVAVGDEGAIKTTPEFIATFSPEGLLQLRGRVTDERLRSAVEGFARAQFTSAEVDPAMRVDDSLPEGWAGRVFAGVSALSLLRHGSLVVQPDFLDIRGATGDQTARADISRLLSEQLGEGENFAIAVRYLEALDPTADLPSPEECVARITAVLEVQKISFDPGSADIAADSLGSVGQIAAIMEKCSDVKMEIAAHSDSQGREIMNQQLSQQRAQAVLSALQARRVLTSNLYARGYGEDRPIADNDTEEGREANRRIEFTLLVEETSDTAETDAEPEADGEAKPAPETETANE